MGRTTAPLPHSVDGNGEFWWVIVVPSIAHGWEGRVLRLLGAQIPQSANFFSRIRRPVPPFECIMVPECEPPFAFFEHG